jgi:quinol monooxygenase YgiN
MGVIVIAAYRPKEGKAEEVLALTREHHGILAKEGLVTPRTPILMRSSDDTVVEVFEWVSQAAIETAHANPAVLELWARYAEISEYVKLPQLPESEQLFAGFASVD